MLRLVENLLETTPTISSVKSLALLCLVAMNFSMTSKTFYFRVRGVHLLWRQLRQTTMLSLVCNVLFFVVINVIVWYILFHLVIFIFSQGGVLRSLHQSSLGI